MKKFTYNGKPHTINNLCKIYESIHGTTRGEFIMSETHADGDLEPVYIKVGIGEENRDNQIGNFYNAVDEVTSYFQSQSGASDAILAKSLRLFADRMDDE